MACTIYFVSGGTTGPIGDYFYNGGWKVPPSTGYSGTIAIPTGPADGHSVTFVWPFASDPGDLVSFSFTRNGDNVDDTCTAAQVVGLQLRY